MGQPTDPNRTNIPAWLVFAAFTFFLILNIISWNFPFFWDTLLTSTISTWFFDNGWQGGIPPTEMDAGHPPLFYGYLLLWWKVAGRSLLFSHLAMLPFLWIAVYQFIQIAARILKDRRSVIIATLLFCLETTILAQSTMISYDIVLLAFYLFALRYILDKKYLPTAIAAAILCLTSIRGVVLVAALFFTEILIYRDQRQVFSRSILKYLPALVLFGLWNAWHFNQTGWMLFTPAEQWNEQRGFAGIRDSLLNFIAITRVHLEPGRLLLYMLIGIGLMQYFLLPAKISLKRPLLLAAVPLGMLSLFFIPFSNPIGHRYFMVVFALSIILFTAIVRYWKFGNLTVALTAIILISGHFWIYPNPVSNGWDSSLGHTAWFKVDRQLNQYLDEQGISPGETMSHFPIDVSGDQKFLNGNMDAPQKIDASNRTRYIIESNISNDFVMNDIIMFGENCSRIYTGGSGLVYVHLYDCGD